MTWCRIAKRAEQLNVITCMPMKTWRRVAMAKSWCTIAKPFCLFASYGASSQRPSTNGTWHARRSCWTCLVISLPKRLAIWLFSYTQWSNGSLVLKLLQGYVHKECTTTKSKGIILGIPPMWQLVKMEKALKSSTPLHCLNHIAYNFRHLKLLWINALILKCGHMHT